jgi:photosystem II stability/assembly factor-like uncharacterized protein
MQAYRSPGSARNQNRRRAVSTGMRYLAPSGMLAAALLPITLVSGCGDAAAPVAAHSVAYSRATAAAGPSAHGSFIALSFTAVSAAHWWILGAVPCGARDCLSIRTTTDAGAHFRSLPAPPVAFTPGAAPAESISFADADDGWVFGPKLYASHDGGRRWTAVSMPGSVGDLQAGAGEIYADVFQPTPCSRTGTCTSRTPAPHLWRARPSSNHWTVDRAGGAVSSLAVHGASVWVVNATLTRDGYALGTRLLHSANAGRTFAIEPEPVTGIFCQYSPVSPTFLWAYCSGGHFMFPYVSSDGGAHFAAVGTEAARITPVDYPNGSELIAASARTAVAASSVSTGKLGTPLIRSIDEGAHWQVVQPQPTSNGQWSLIGFTTPKVGYALWQSFAHGHATTELWRTTDAGATWTPVTTLS